MHCPDVKKLNTIVEDARESAATGRQSVSDEPFYDEAFRQHIGCDLRTVIALVTIEAVEEALYQFTDRHTSFFGNYELPLLIIRTQPSLWIDEK